MASALFQTCAPLVLVLLIFCFYAQCDLEIDTIEGSSKDVKGTKEPKGSRSGGQSKSAGNVTKKEFKCIVCDDIKDTDCQPWNKTSYSQNCYSDPRINHAKPIGCRKMIQKVEGKTYVSRHCTNLVEDNIQGCIERVGTKRIRVVYCHCRTSMCNGVGQRNGDILMIFIPIALVLLQRL